MRGNRSTPPGRGRMATRALLAVAMLALTATGTASAQNNTTASQASSGCGNTASQVAWLQYISAELRRIHVELLEDRRDMQQAKMKDLERELDTIRTQQQQLQEEQHAQTQQAADVEAQLVQPSLTQAERQELEAQRADLLALSPSRFGSAHNALTQREARARERLAIQEQHVRTIDRQIGELSAGSQ